MPGSSPFIALGALFFSISLGLAVLVGIPQSGAFLTNAGAANQNPIHGGVLDLKLTETGPTNGEGSTTDESAVDIAHDTWEDTAHDALGGDNVSNTLTLDNNASTVGATRVNISVSSGENDSDTNDGNAPNTSQTIEVTGFVYGGTDLAGNELTDQNGNSQVDVEDLSLGTNVENLSSLSGVAAGDSTTLTIHLSGSADLIAGVGSGDGIDITITVRVHARSFTEADRSVNNTIRYA